MPLSNASVLGSAWSAVLTGVTVCARWTRNASMRPLCFEICQAGAEGIDAAPET